MNIIDIFCGCGGLTEGFLSTKKFNTLAIIDWDKPSLDTLKHRMKTKWGYSNIEDISIHYDIQNIQKLINGFNDELYGKSQGLNKILGNNKVDLIVGGPPCQAYSLAGRVRDKNGMKDDYRNYLFESFVKLVSIYKPKAFIFENVLGMLSAKPGDILITDRIREAFNKAGYEISEDLRREAVFNMSYYGIPQERKRVIIFGVKKSQKSNISLFYENLRNKEKLEQEPLKNYLKGLPKFRPVSFNENLYTYKSIDKNNLKNHIPRKQSKRDVEIFKILTKDIETEKYEYISTQERIDLYKKFTGRKTNFFKHNVLKYDKPSNTIPAHLYKDGLRHIHPDSKQARTITPREAALIQSFPNDFEFLGSQTDQFKMIGNAVPPRFSKLIAETLLNLFN